MPLPPFRCNMTMQLIGTKAHGTATSSMGGPLASGVDRQIVLKAHEASDLKNVFRRDEKAECVASRKPSPRSHDQSQELFCLSKSRIAKGNLNMVDDLCRSNQKTLSVNFVFMLARAAGLIAS